MIHAEFMPPRPRLAASATPIVPGKPVVSSLPFASPLEGLRQYRALSRCLWSRSRAKHLLTKARNAAMQSDQTQPLSINLDDHDDPDAVLCDLLCATGYAPSDPFKDAKDSAVFHAATVCLASFFLALVVGYACVLVGRSLGL